MALKFVQDKKTTLAGSGCTSSATSIILSDLTLPDGTTALTTADLGSICYATIEPGTSKEEQISFTGITANSDGTYTITGVTRGLRFVDPYDSVTANKYAHSGGSIFIITNTAGFYGNIKAYIDAIALAGTTNATTSVQGLVELGTTAEVNAGTATGGTGAALAVTPDALLASNYGLNLPSAGEKAALAGGTTFGTPASTNKYITQAFPHNGIDQSQTSTDSTAIFGEANATTKHYKIAQSFIPTKANILGVSLWKIADSGSFTGTVTVSIQADSAGSPSGSALATVTITNATWLLIPSAAAFDVAFTSEYTMTIGSTYWIVIETSTADNANHPNLGALGTGTYTNGSSKYNNSTDGWLTYGTFDLYFKTYQGTASTLVYTNSTGLIPPLVLPYSFVDMDSTNSSAVSSSTTETTVYTKILPAGFFTANSGIKLSGIFTCGGISGSYQQVAIYFNNTAVATFEGSGGSVFPDNSSGNAIEAAINWTSYIINNNSLSSQKYFAIANYTNANGTTVYATNTYTAESTNNIARSSGFYFAEGTGAVSTAGVVVLRVTLKNSASNASTKFRHENIIVEKIG